jgi:hypothetical protein
MSIFEQFNNPHWSKPFFNENKIPLKVVSKFINRDYFLTSRLLSGTIPPTPETEARIGQLVISCLCADIKTCIPC